MTKLEQKEYIDKFIKNNFEHFNVRVDASGKELLKILNEIQDLPQFSFKTRLKITSMIIRAYLLVDE